MQIGRSFFTNFFHTSSSHCPHTSQLDFVTHYSRASPMHDGMQSQSIGSRRSVSERAACCSGRVVARAAAVGNAVAARQVIVIGAAVPLSPRPSLSHAHRCRASQPCASASTPLLLFTLASPFDPAPQPTLSIFAVRWVVPPQGRPHKVEGDGGGRMHSFLF